MKRLHLNVLLVMVMVVATMEFHGSVITDHIVGDSFGWAVPFNPLYYEGVWANSQMFFVNDGLIFNFATGNHTVAQVKGLFEYNACDGSNPVQMFTNGPARVELSTIGKHYYICTSHCQKGMKMVITANAPQANNSTLA